MKQFDEAKTVLITGAAKGIGRAVALAMADDGWTLLLHSCHSEEAMRGLCRQLDEMKTPYRTFRADLSNAEGQLSLIGALEREGLMPGAFIHNAGVSEWGLLTDLKDKDWDALMEVNLHAACRLSQALIPSMVRRKSGQILFISSIWGISGASCEAAYAASKAGLISLARSLARELGPSGIRVNAVAPGVIDTDMLQRFSPDEKRALEDLTPLCRLGSPGEVADAVAFLCSDKASFISGQCLSVDGGFSA